MSKAFQCLSDEESRKKYCLAREDESVFERRATRSGPRTHHHHHGYYEGDVDARKYLGTSLVEWLLQLFGHGMGPRQGEHASGGFNLRALIQLLPVLLLNFLPSSEPIYSLSRSYPYGHRFTTTKSVNSYVTSKEFDEDYPLNSPEHISIEERVEREYFSIL